MGMVLSLVIAGLDPAIHRTDQVFMMDARVKPAHDDYGEPLRIGGWNASPVSQGK
jgi:hypothetical protein